MRFGSFPLGETEGAILAHSLRAGGRLLKKGRVLTQDDIAQLRNAGVSEVSATRLEAGDVPEDVAATRVAQALRGNGLRMGAAFTGRVNLYAEKAGIITLDGQQVDALNLIDESITVATLAPFAMVAPGEMVATVKVIPFAAPEAAVSKAEVTAAKAPIGLAGFKPMNVALISTE